MTNGVMGFGSPPPARQPSTYDRVLGGLLGAPSSYGGLLSPEDQKAAQQRALMAMGAQLMAASGPSQAPVSVGQALAPALMAGQQAQQQYGNDMLQAMLLRTKLQQAKQGPRQPSDVQSYEYAKAAGYKGTFEDWKRVGSAQPQETADVQNWKFFNQLTEGQRKQWLAMQRQPTAPQVVMINGVPHLVDRIQQTTTPLTTLQQEIGATTEKAEAEAAAKARGAATGEAQGGLAKKGINAMNVLETIDLADPLVDVATGSATGAAADKVASFFGSSLDGDQAIAQLKILQANLMTNMPRMEGPQSDRDVQLYREAAGEIGEPMVPRARKKAALQMIRALQQKYAEGAPVSAKSAPVDVGETTTINGVKVKRVK